MDSDVVLESFLETIDDIPRELKSNLARLKDLDQRYQAQLQQLRFQRQQFYEKTAQPTVSDEVEMEHLKEYNDRYSKAFKTVNDKVAESRSILEHFQTHIARLERDSLRVKCSDKLVGFLTESQTNFTLPSLYQPQIPPPQLQLQYQPSQHQTRRISSYQTPTTRADSEESTDYMWPENNPVYRTVGSNVPQPSQRVAAQVANSQIQVLSNKEQQPVVSRNNGSGMLPPPSTPVANTSSMVGVGAFPTPAATVVRSTRGASDRDSVVSLKRKATDADDDLSYTGTRPVVPAAAPNKKQTMAPPGPQQRQRTHSTSSTTAKSAAEEDNTLYCTCQQISFGNMVACDNDNCDIEWFHWGCVGLTSTPKGSWYCPTCTARGFGRSGANGAASVSGGGTRPGSASTSGTSVGGGNGLGGDKGRRVRRR
ncbi:hypothetical protein SmJEL517_g01159 [Synchytrium microbalum]|uniref:Chromatin modification-related protein n=1 Tax=Synchytrium microbalum TaxID=1806994 RepID=A0A507CBT2_9FUNG|nr:uncharacterized protein SmJEL517_g01159 [Synchytrium microbalum]TPX36619.1 hypothetical protein SmJEL517_g01159 [Synchytrium microbalum]